MAGRELFPFSNVVIFQSQNHCSSNWFQTSRSQPQKLLGTCCQRTDLSYVVPNKTKHHVWKLVLCRHRPCFQSGMKLLALLRTDTLQKSHCTSTVLDRLKYVYSIYICIHIYIQIHTYLHICIDVRFLLNVQIHAFAHVYIYIYTHNIYIYTHAPVTYTMYGTRLVF